jgi:hypothetical protein
MNVSLKTIFQPDLKLLSLALVSLVLPAQATVYFVDSGSGSDSNPGTSTNAPWAHPPGSVGFSGSGWPASIVAGDKIIIKGGSVNNVSFLMDSSETHYNGSSAFDSIVIQSGHLFSPQWGTTRAIFDGQNTRLYGMGLDGTHTCNGITIDGFEIRNIAPGVSAINGNGSACIEVAGATYFTVKHCWGHDAPRIGDDQGFGIESGAVAHHYLVYQNEFGPNIGTKGIEMYNTSFGVVSNNFFHGTRDHSIVIGSAATNVDVCNNLVYMDGSPAHQPIYGIEVVSGVNCDVWNNIVYFTAPYGGGPSAFGMYEYDIGNRVVFNTFAFLGDLGNDASGTAIRAGDGTGKLNTASLFQNNLFYRNKNADGNIQYCVPYPANVNQENVQYNCVWGGVSTSENVMAYRVQGNANDTVSPLSTYDPPTTGHTYANNLQVDPVITGGSLPTGLDANYYPNTTYFTLSGATPPSVTSTGNAISGDSVHGWDHSPGKFSKDILGNTRTSWSMGAYEVSAGQGVLVSVTPSSQNFGSISEGATSNLTFTVKNTGSSTLSGTATVAPPFQIASGGTYSLAANQSQTVTVSYTPTTSGIYQQTVTFSGGGGATATVSGTALPPPPTGLYVR